MRYFFTQDIDNVWYMLPISLSKTWSRLYNKKDRGDYDGWVEIEKHKLKKSIETITFKNPKNTIE